MKSPSNQQNCCPEQFIFTGGEGTSHFCCPIHCCVPKTDYEQPEPPKSVERLAEIAKDVVKVIESGKPPTLPKQLSEKFDREFSVGKHQGVFGEPYDALGVAKFGQPMLYDADTIKSFFAKEIRQLLQSQNRAAIEAVDKVNAYGTQGQVKAACLAALRPLNDGDEGKGL